MGCEFIAFQKACETGKPSLHNSELDRIEASIKSFVQRAYDLGRIDTLRKVVEELNALDPSAKFSVDVPPGALPKGLNRADFAKAIQGHNTAEASLVARFYHPVEKKTAGKLMSQR